MPYTRACHSGLCEKMLQGGNRQPVNCPFNARGAGRTDGFSGLELTEPYKANMQQQRSTILRALAKLRFGFIDFVRTAVILIVCRFNFLSLSL